MEGGEVNGSAVNGQIRGVKGREQSGLSAVGLLHQPSAHAGGQAETLKDAQVHALGSLGLPRLGRSRDDGRIQMRTQDCTLVLNILVGTVL